MSLSENERIVLSAACLDADMPAQELAQRTGLKEHIVRRTLESFEAKGTIKRVTYIDVYPLGYHYFEVYFRLLPGIKNKAEIISYLQQSPQVSYFAQTGGELEFNMDVIAHKATDIIEFFDKLTEFSGGAIAEKKILVVESLCDYPLRFLAPTLPGQRVLSFGNTETLVAIDELDHEILRLISARQMRSTAELARTLGAKASTIQYRLDRLKQNKVIVGYRFLPNLVQLGYQVFDFQIQTRGVSKSVKDAVNAFVEKEPAVYALLRTLGDWDFLLIAALQTTEEVDQLTAKISDALGKNLVRITAHPLIRHHKISFYPLEKFSPFGSPPTSSPY